MKSVLIEGPNSFRVAEIELEAVPPGYLLLAPLLVGICGTDLELIDGSMVYLRNGVARYPLSPGHEWVARVLELGSGVTGFAVGDTVVGEVSVGCDDCSLCSTGNYHRCSDRSETGFMGISGALREQMLFPARSAHRVPAGVSLGDAAMTEPLAIAYRAVERAEISHGEKILVVGMGTIGMLAALVLRATGDAHVSFLSDNAYRSKQAEDRGFSAHIPGERYPRVIEAAGSEGAVREALSALAPGGRLVLAGLTGQPEIPLPVDNIVIGDLEVIGTLGSPGVWPAVLALLDSQKVHPAELVTHTFRLNEFPEAIELARDKQSGTGKILIQVNEGNTDG